MTAVEIKELRSQKKLTQQQLGNLCGVGKAAVSRWEKKLSKPSGPSLLALKRLVSGRDSIVPVSELEIKLLDQNVKQGNFKNREEYLTQSLKHLLVHGDFKTNEATTSLMVAENTVPYNP